MSLSMITAPANEPVTAADARAHLRISHSHEDALLERLIVAAREEVEQRTGRALIDQNWRYTLDKLPQTRILRIPKAPLSAVTGVYIYGHEGTQHEITAQHMLQDLHGNPPRLRLTGTLPVSIRTMMGVEVDFKAGYGPDQSYVPASLQLAILHLVGFWYERRSMVEEGLVTGLIPHGFEAGLSPFKLLKL
ncbi:head-tail connector protein [Flexibacterium corallicola]|uniref:head-tail connector protein n=1 Tax=Flexibacterium corallicola TaxID=3037259 RepID=UPI00286F6FF1|nr:head-tail connector protein [Pseudovibrio sp. M1P-2-3]